MAMTAAQVRAYRQKMSGGKSGQDKDQSVETKTMTAEDVRAYRQKVQAQSEQKQKEANSVQGRMAQSRSDSGVRTATESPLQTRVQLPQGSTDTRWMGGGTRQLGTLDSKKLADEVLDSVLGTATGSPVKTDRQEDYEPDWNYAGGDNTPQQRAQAANAVKRDDFDRWNLWMDADTRHRELVDLMRQKEQDYTSYAQQGTSARAPTAGAGGGAYTSYAQSGTSRSAGEEKETKAKYTDAQLRGMGYSQQEIDKARQYLTEYPAYNPAEVFVRRGADTAKGIAATVAAAPLLVGENLGVSIWNEMETRKNWKALREEVQGDTRQEKLLGMLTGGKTTYAQQGSTATSMQPYTDAELLEKGYTQAEIDTMRSRIAGTKVADSSDKDTLGYKLYDYGQRHTAAAQAGMTPAARTAMGVVSSAAENLAVAGVSPYLVLPVLSAQGAAESMGQSVEKGQSAGRTLATGLAKFGAGWAINSVGVADLAESMGADYAKNTLAAQIAGWVRGLGGDSAFKQNYPAVVNALTGGVDNAVQAFVETYADTAIDAVLGGDEEAAEALLKPETFLTALQSGLTGGASGALGGAVGTGLGAMSKRIEYKANGADAAAPVQGTAEQQVQQEETPAPLPAGEQAGTPSPLQSGDAGAATELPPRGSLSQRNETAVDDDPAKHTPAQNARIAEYKDSADLKLAEYVDRVRAGEQPAPYMVTETSDRMRDAMQQLTGLDKVGSVTMMDANAVRHITNRHAGGDGSADATMKESADVARAGYVLNNFDNAYLSNRRAEGYFDSTGKRAPIVIFEKKIDGSHVIVEAVLDSKKGKNYIVTEYLAKNGVDAKEIAKALRPPMDAAESDPRHTSETLNAVTSAIPIAEGLRSPVSAVADPEAHVRNVVADPSAATTVPQRDGQVNVEKAGKNVESAQEYADVELHAEMENLDTDSWTRTEQMDTARQLTRRAQMSEKAVQTVVDNMPHGIGAQIYAPAAASLYRLGIDGHAETFEAALQKTGKGGLSGGVQQVLALGDAGRTALNIAFLQGKGEAEHYREVKAAQLGQRPGKAALHDEAGIYYKADGSVSAGTKAEDAFIELSAKASGVAAQRVVTGLAKNAKGLLQSAAGRVFYSSEADAGTVMHETLHELNSWDSKGAQELIDRFGQYLVQQNGMDSVQQLVQGYLDRYANAGQKLTYNQAMEEITADAVRTIFGTEESFKTFLRVQAAEAKMNAQAQGRCERVMQKIETLLQKVLADIKTVLGREPDNAAARAAKTLTEQQLADLRELYFDHQIEAGANYRAALEANGGMEKAAAADAAAAEGVRYSLPDMAKETEAEKTKRQMAMIIRPAEQNAERTAKVSGQEWSGMKVQEARKAILELMKEFGIVNKFYQERNLNVAYQYRTDTARKSANHQMEVSGREFNDLALVQANIEEVLQNAVPLEAHADKKGKPHVDGMIVLASALRDGERIIPVRAELKLFDNEPTSLYIALAETTAENSRDTANKKRTGSKMEESTQKDTRQPSTGSSDLNILDYYRLVNHDANFTKYFSDEVAQKAEGLEVLRDEQRQLDEQRRELKEERSAWLESEAVKEIEAKKKALGVFSAEAKSYRDSAEYQNYLAKRKDYNSRLAQLEERSAALDDRMREAGERIRARANAKANDRQLTYNVQAEKHGGKAEYRRVLAKEQFGVTEDFKKAGYILPDGQMLDFAQNDRSRDTDHREILDVFGPAEVKTGTEALNKFLQDGNVRVMAEAPGIDLSADIAPTAQQLEQIRKMAEQLGSERGQFTLDISTADGKVAASKEYSGRVDADKVVREIQAYYKTGELAQESEFAKFRYQLDVDAEDVEAARSQSVGDGGAQSQTVAKVMELAENAAVSDDSLLYIARKVAKAAGSKVDTKTLASRLAALRDYLNSGNVDWAEAHGFVLDMAQQIMEKSAKRNDALWKQYPELHEMGMSLEKGGKDYREVVYKYGSWAGATKELARHGVKLTLTKNGTVSRWDADFTELQGIGGGLLPAETPSSAADALEAMAAAHDAIRPTMESAYDTDWDAAKQEIGMQIWGEYLGLPGVANESNAALRRKFSQQTKEMNEKARKHALALQAQANLEAAKQRARNRQKMAKPYADATAKAKEHYAETEEKLREKLGTAERKMQQQAAVWREAERGRTREKVALEKAKNAQRLEKMRESRDKDYTRREIRKLAGELTKLYDHPKEDKYIPDYLVDKVLPVVQLANEAVGNREAAQRVAQWMHRGEKGYRYTPAQDTRAGMEKAVDGLRRGIKDEIKAGERANLEWEQSGLADAIDNWLTDVNQNREREIARVEAAIREAQEFGNEYGGIDGTALEARLDELRTELNGYRNGGMAMLSAEELRGLREILDQTVHIIKIDNVVVGAQEDVAIDEFAEGTKEELKEAGGVSRRNGWLGKLDRKFNIYRMNTMNIERMFERMGGYAHGGYMENLGKMLNDGQRKKTKILIEGTRIFDNVTGKAHERELYHFTHDLIDIGLVDEAGKTRRITHNQLAELYLQLQNRQGLHHILHGGITLDNMEAWVKGDSELAELDRETVRVGEMNLRDAEGKLLRAQDIAVDEDAARRNLLDEIDKNLTDFDRVWIEDYRKLNELMSGYINETSLLLSGVRKATTENYIHINVDQDTNPEQNTGIRYDNSVGNPGWLNHRVNSAKPVLLVGLVQQVNTSIENTAQYAGMAIPLRNAEKILNSRQDGKTLFTQVEKTWGKAGRAYLNKALADLCGVKDSREVGDGLFSRMRSMAAQAVLNANVNVTLLQAASLPTAAAELGWGSTGPAAVQFGKNILPGELAKIEARMAEHGEELLQYRLRGTGHAELGSAGAQKAGLQRAHDAARNSDNAALRTAVHAADAAVSLWTGGITKMDEITVAALWAGCENYVKNHPAEFSEGAEVTDSKAYWAAVNEKFQRVVERTQPNYTTMQRTGMQRTTNEMAKFLMMFSTQRQQNAQIWTASVEDVIAQYDRYGNSKTEQAKAAKKEAWERFGNAATSQVFQTSVIAVLGVGVKFLLHRWKDLQDENGDMTKESIWDALLYDFCKSFIGNWTGGSEVMSVGEMIMNHSFTSYDTISMTGISAINDLAEYIGRVSRLNAVDTSGMTEEELEKHAEKTKEAVADMLGQFAMLRGIPYTNLKKQVNAVSEWIDTFKNWNEEGGNFDSLPTSATGQYDRLYNAYASGDSVEAQAAVEKLSAMGKEDKIYSELKKRLKQYDPDVLEAAKAQNSGDTERREELTRQIVQKVYEVMGIDPKAKADEARRAKVIGMVTSDKTGDDDTEGAINALADELLETERGHKKDAGIYVDLTMAAEKGSAEELQEELDRLLRAGKSISSVKSKITAVCKPEYVAGSEYDREQLDEMLLALRDADDNPLYEQKTLDGWVSDAEKKSKAQTSDPWADLR